MLYTGRVLGGLGVVGQLMLWGATRDLLGIYSEFAREIFVDCIRCLTVGMGARCGGCEVWWMRGVVGARRGGCEA